MKVTRYRLKPEGPLRSVLWVASISSFVLGWGIALFALVQGDLGGGDLVLVVALSAGLVGTLMPMILLRLAVDLRISDTDVTVGIRPFLVTSVKLASLTSVEYVHVDPLGDYGGWGVKGPKDDILYGLSGTNGVRLRHDAGDVTVLTEDPEIVDSLIGLVNS